MTDPLDRPVYAISQAAELAGMHAQTLRQYDRLELVAPRRAAGRGRRYSLRDIARLRKIQNLSQKDGINLAGIKHILALEDRVRQLEAQADKLRESIMQDRRVFAAGSSGDIVALPRGQRMVRERAQGTLVIWRPQSD